MPSPLRNLKDLKFSLDILSMPRLPLGVVDVLLTVGIFKNPFLAYNSVEIRLLTRYIKVVPVDLPKERYKYNAHVVDGYLAYHGHDVFYWLQLTRAAIKLATDYETRLYTKPNCT